MSYKDWPPTCNEPAPLVPEFFTKELSRIGGFAPDGRPKLRLVWGQDPEISVFWQGKRRLRYLYLCERRSLGWRSSHYDEAGQLKEVKIFEHEPPASDALIVEQCWELKDIGIPRFFIEQLMPAAHLIPDWHEIRYDFDPETKEFVDSMGPPPTEGEYQEGFYCIADHQECCGTRQFKGVRCPGEYRPPDSRDLAYVEWLVRQLNDEPYRYSWEEVPPPEVVVQSIKDKATKRLNEKAKRVEEKTYIIKDSIARHTLFGGGHFDLGAAFQRARKF